MEIGRRDLLARAARLGLAASTLGALETAVRLPDRASAAIQAPEIQFDVEDAIAPASVIDGIAVRMPPVHTCFLTLRLRRLPTVDEQRALRQRLNVLERRYGLSAGGLLLTLGYGRSWFDRLPAARVRSHIPRLLADHSRSVLEDAVASPSDPASVVLERNDLLIVLRSDRLAVVSAAARSLSASLSSCARVTSRRLMFQQVGLPRQVAVGAGLPYAGRLSPRSPMWMGFADQQVSALAPAAAVTFRGTPSTRLTTARKGDYFDRGAIVHLSHLLLDLDAFYGLPYGDRAARVFRPNPVPAAAGDDGIGPAFIENTFRDRDDAAVGARAGVIGHLAAVQRASRAADGTPVQLRLDGPGFDSLDVPGGGNAPKVHFSIFVPSAATFADLRTAQASRDLSAASAVPAAANGIESFITATRRQNFLVPPRRHRAFPLLEL